MARYSALMFVLLIFALAVWTPLVKAQKISQDEKAPGDLTENDQKEKAINDVWNKIFMTIATPFEESKTSKGENNTIGSGKVETFGFLLSTFNGTQTFPAKKYDAKETNKKIEENTEDECDLYGKILAKKLRKYPESMRVRVIYKIDGLLLNNPYPEIASNSTTESPKAN